MSKKVTFFFVLLMVISLVAIYFALEEKSITNYPDEKFIKDIYSHSIQEKNKDAVIQFGLMVKSEQKVEIDSFDLNKCETTTEKIICYVTSQVKSPRYGLQKKKFEFYFKPEHSSFKFLGFKQL